VVEYGLNSDVLSLSGLGSSTCVLEINYDPNTFVLQDGHDAQWYAEREWVCLAWLDPGDGIWKNAVLGNTGGQYLFCGLVAWDGDANVGHWGVDFDHDKVWAVLDHNSQFSVTPEPAVLGLLALGGGLLAARRRRNRRQQIDG
jgi:hypothetical protein